MPSERKAIDNAIAVDDFPRIIIRPVGQSWSSNAVVELPYSGSGMVSYTQFRGPCRRNVSIWESCEPRSHTACSFAVHAYTVGQTSRNVVHTVGLIRPNL